MTYVGTRPPHALRYHKSGGSSRFSYLEALGGLALPLRLIAHARNLVLIRVGEGLRPGWLGSGLGGKVKFGRDGRHAGAATTTLTSVAFLVIWKMLGAFALFPRTTHGAQRPPLWSVTCLRPSCKREE